MTNKHPDPIFVLRGSHHSISSVNFVQPDENEESIKYLASGSQDGHVSVWDLKIRGVELEWAAHKSTVLWLKYMNRSTLWTSGKNESATMWDLSQGSAKEVIKVPLEDYVGFSQCDITSFENRTLLCVPGSSLNSVTLWDVNSHKKICCLTPRDANALGSVMQCKWVKFGVHLYLLVSYENGTLALWDWPNNKKLSTLSCNDTPVSLEFDSCLMKGICGTASEKIFMFRIEEENCEIHFETEFNIMNPGIGCIGSRPDSKIYALGGWDYRIRLFSWKKNKPLAVLMYHKKAVECITFSKAPVQTLSKGYLLAAGSSDKSISLWDIYN